MAAGAVLAAANGVGEGLVQDLVYEGALPGPGHTGYAGKDPERELDVHALEVVLGRAEEPYDPARLAALFRRLYPAASREEIPRHGALLGLDVLDGAGGDDLAPVHPRPGPHVHDVIRRPDRLLIVLDDDERVPEVPQPYEGVQQPPVVSLVQPDGGLVEDVENAHEA